MSASPGDWNPDSMHCNEMKVQNNRWLKQRQRQNVRYMPLLFLTTESVRVKKTRRIETVASLQPTPSIWQHITKKTQTSKVSNLPLSTHNLSGSTLNLHLIVDSQLSSLAPVSHYSVIWQVSVNPLLPNYRLQNCNIWKSVYLQRFHLVGPV